MRTLLALTLGLLTLSAVLLSAGDIWAGDEFKVVSDDFPGSFAQFGASIASDASGNFVVAWRDHRASEDMWVDPAGYFQRFTALGEPIGDNVQFTDTVLSYWGNTVYVEPKVAMRSDGRFAVAAALRMDYETRAVAVWLYGADGSLQYGPLEVSADTTVGTYNHVDDIGIGYNDNGHLLVAWVGNDRRVYGRWLDDQGGVTSDVFDFRQESPDTVRGFAPLEVVLSNDDRVMVGAEASINNVNTVMLWFSPYGSTTAQPAALDQETASATVGDTIYWVDSPVVARHGSGGYAAVWERHTGIGTEWGYYLLYREYWGQALDQSGSPIGTPVRVVDTSEVGWSGLRAKGLAATENGFLLVGYDHTDTVLHCQPLSLDAAPAGDFFRVYHPETIWSLARLSVVPAGSSRLIVAYQGKTNQDYRDDVMVYGLSPTGAEIFSARRAHDDRGSNQLEPQITSDALGQMYVVWLDDRETMRQCVYGRRIWNDGTPIGDALKLSHQDDYWVRSVAMHGNTSGQAVAVWVAWQNANYDPERVYAQRLGSPNYSPIGDNIVVSDEAHVSSEFMPAVAVGSDGSFVVAYRGTTVDSWDERPYDVYVRKYSSSGSPVTSLMKANEGESELLRDWSGTMAPSITIAEDGSFAVVWVAGEFDPMDPGRFPIMQRYAPTGTPIGGNVQVTDYPWTEGARPTVAVNGAMQYAVGWSGAGVWAGEEGYQQGAWMQVIDSLGNALSDYRKLSDQEPQNAGTPSLVHAGPDGNFFAAWHHPKEGTQPWTFNDYDIWTVRIAPNGEQIGTRLMINQGDFGADQVKPALARTDTTLFFAWEDWRNPEGNADVYARILGWNDLSAGLGDVDLSGATNVADLTYLVAYLFLGGPEPVEMPLADVNLDGKINVLDLSALVEYLFG